MPLLTDICIITKINQSSFKMEKVNLYLIEWLKALAISNVHNEGGVGHFIKKGVLKK